MLFLQMKVKDIGDFTRILHVTKLYYKHEYVCKHVWIEVLPFFLIATKTIKFPNLNLEMRGQENG